MRRFPVLVSVLLFGCATPRFAGESHEANLDDPVRYHLAYIDLGHRSGQGIALREEYGKRLAESPDDPVAHVLHGRTMADDNAAFETYQQALELDQDNYWALVSVGEVHGRLDAHGEAVKALERAARLQPAYPQAHAALGDVYRKQGNDKAAALAYQRAIELDPDSLTAHRGLGQLKLNAGQRGEALAQLTVASNMAPWDFDLHLHVAELMDQTGKRAEAHDHFRAATDLNKENPRAWYGRARTARASGMTEDAIRSLERVLALQTYHHLARRDLADLLRESGDHARAVTLYRDAVTATPGDLDAHLGLARAYVGLGQRFRALEAYESLLARAPKDPRGQRQLLDLLRELGANSEPLAGTVPQVLQRAAEVVRSCFAKVHVNRPELGGTLAARMTIDANGEATLVEVTDDTLQSDGLTTCMRWALSTAVYPRNQATTANFVVTLP